MFEEIIQEGRVEKLRALKSLGVEPYPYEYSVTTTAREIHDNVDKLEKQSVSIAGRIVSIREHGKTVFMNLRDSSGDIQIYLRKDSLEPVTRGETNLWQIWNYLESGDIVGVSGEVFKTHKGETTIWVKDYHILAKSLYPIPYGKQKGDEKWYSVSDPEIKYRERYIHWNVHPEERACVVKRAQMLQTIREFMNARGFLEVLTPNIEMVYGGAEARPFETQIWALGGQKSFLRISPELYLKRYIVAGFPKVYTICQNFRNEGIDKSHNPEFSMMEWYEAYTDYHYQMKQFEELVHHVAVRFCGQSTIHYQGTEVNFSPPWKRLRMIDAIKELADFDIENASDAKIEKFMKEREIPYQGEYKKGLAIQIVFEKLCESKLVQPTFILDHPLETSPLTKRKRGNPEFVERFEPFILGMELGNAYSELTDPIEQYERFKEQRGIQKEEDFQNHPIDWDFLKAIACGMPPTGGVGLGIDRLLMVLSDVPSIRDIIPFPLIKPRKPEDGVV